MPKQQSLSAGFTIIETLFVIAIAGIIMLIVFQAIPTLNRNARNHDRKQDVATILEGVSHYELTNSGNIPPPCGGNGDDGSLTCKDAFLQHTTLHYYDLGGVSVIPQTSALSFNYLSSSFWNHELVLVVNYHKCIAGTQGLSTSSGAGYFDVVALYFVEKAGSQFAFQCQQL